MSCGWCKVPLADLASLDTEKGFKESLVGGTPFVGEAIKKNEVRQRRHGWRKVRTASLSTRSAG
jgi:hypothetical protein